ncbi:MAG: SBBP repeat-containing protein [Bacteroidota bacterium]|nr:SBBP repeat-containing protein [Bacteroidota bacterium]
MKKTFTIFTMAIAIMCISTKLQAQDPQFEWAAGFGGPDYDQGKSVAVDASGNVYTTGYFYGTVDFDPGSGTYNLSSNGRDDIFISKLDASGNFVWAKNMGGSDWNEGYSIAIDASGNVYTTGHFEGTADFDPGSGTYILSSNNGYDDIFISKLDASGNFVWAKAMGGSFDDNGFALAIDASGNVYTTGIFCGTADFEPGSGTYNLSSNGDYDIFISKLDASGNFVWAKSMGGSSDDRGYSIALDASGNVYTTGYFYSSTVDFDPGSGTYNLTSNGCGDIFISKLDASGNFVWAKNMGGSSSDGGNSIAIDASGNVYTTGSFLDTADFDPGSGTHNLSSNGEYDIFISKLDASGNFVWAKSMSGSSSEWGFSIALDASGNVYTTGYFYGTVDFDPGSGTYNLSSNGVMDIYILKLSQYLVANFSASDTTITLGDTIQFTDLTTGNPTSWLWNFGDGITDTMQNPIHIYQTIGVYTVSLVVSDSTSSDICYASIVVIDDIGISEIESKKDLEAYPNPFSDHTQIDYYLHKKSEVKLAIYNNNGALVRILVSGSKPAGNHSIIWDGTNTSNAKCAPGIYIIKLESNEMMKYQKISLGK